MRLIKGVQIVTRNVQFNREKKVEAASLKLHSGQKNLWLTMFFSPVASLFSVSLLHFCIPASRSSIEVEDLFWEEYDAHWWSALAKNQRFMRNIQAYLTFWKGDHYANWRNLRSITRPYSTMFKNSGKDSFHIANEARYVYILSRQKLIKNAKNSRFGRLFEKLAVK